MPSTDRITVPKFVGFKSAGHKITMLTAYDYSMASFMDESGVDAILVGDTLGMVVQGHETTLPVTIDQMIYHAEIVGRAVRRALVIVDLPFPIHHVAMNESLAAAVKILKKTKCQAVKLEGGADQAALIETLVTAGIPVMAHVGLRPQNVHVMGGYRVQRDHERLLADAQAVQNAGAFAVVLECIPSSDAKVITENLAIPTIGIGAGPDCDGQVLVGHDMLGLTSGYIPSFVKQYADLKSQITEAVQRWNNDVRTGAFPDASHSFR